MHHGDGVGHAHGLLLIVGDDDEGDADLVLQALELQLHLGAHLAVERRQGLVEQEQPRPLDDGAGESDALALATRQLRGAGLGLVGQADRLEHLADACRHLGAGQTLALQAVRDVALHVHVREEGIRLEHQVHRALVGRQGEEVGGHAGGGVDRDRAGVRLLEAGDAPQQRRLAAAGRSEQGEELIGADVDRDVVEGLNRAVGLGHVINGQERSHTESVSRVIRWAESTMVKLTSSSRAARALISGVTPKRTIE